MTGSAGRWEWRTFGPGARCRERLASPGSRRHAGERRGLPPVGRRRDRQGPCRAHGHQAAAGDRRVRPPASGPRSSRRRSRSIVRTWSACSTRSTSRPELDRAAWTFDEFLRELTGPSRGIRAVSVHKRRVRYAPNGCSAEITDVVADGRTARTFAVEGEDAAAVADEVRALGLADYLNTAYPAGLARILAARPSAMPSSTAAPTRSSSTSPSARPGRLEDSWTAPS